MFPLDKAPKWSSSAAVKRFGSHNLYSNSNSHATQGLFPISPIPSPSLPLSHSLLVPSSAQVVLSHFIYKLVYDSQVPFRLPRR